MSYTNLREMLFRHEGIRTKPYLDCCGKWWKECTCKNKGNLSIGVGRNLDAVGVSEIELNFLLDNDITRTAKNTILNLSWYKSLNMARQDVILNMVFNLGIGEFLNFKKLIDALASQNYHKAADEMLCSLWASQVGKRATELAQIMRSGIYI